MKVLIDTNILIDVLSRRQGFEQSAEVWKLCETRQINGIVSALSIANIVYILRRELTPDKTDDLVIKLAAIFDVVDLKAADTLGAARLKARDFEDSVQMLTAKRNSCKYIITQNTRDFEESDIPAIKPGSFLETL